jgi:nucleic acid/nucleotide deaminase of polymorphic system toxin
VDHVVAFSQRGVGHAERLAAKELEARGVPASSVQRIYSQLEPCEQPGGYCKGFLAREFSQAEVTYTHPYPPGPEGAEVRRASVEAMRQGG